MEATILEAEGKVSELEKTLDDPEFYITRSHEATGLIQQLEAAKLAVSELYARWDELEAIRAQMASA